MNFIGFYPAMVLFLVNIKNKRMDGIERKKGSGRDPSLSNNRRWMLCIEILARFGYGFTLRSVASLILSRISRR